MGQLSADCMDLLSGIIERSRLRQHRLVQRQLSGAWGYTFPCHRSGGFHVIQRGRCHLRSSDGVTELDQGDIVFVMRGIEHDLVSAPAQKALPIVRFLESTPRGKTRKDTENSLVDLMSVRYEFPDGEAHPFFKELPAIVVVHGRELPVHDPLLQCLQLLSLESQNTASSGLVLERLTDILLYYALQRWLQAHPARRPGFRSALQDEKVSAVLDLIHRRSFEEWTLQRLARSVGLSRAALALRFRQAMRSTPIDYLWRLRLDAGRDLLEDRTLGLEEIARRVGYSSAFAFSKAYKRVYGKAPRQGRNLRLDEVSAGRGAVASVASR